MPWDFTVLSLWDRQRINTDGVTPSTRPLALPMGALERGFDEPPFLDN